MKEYIILIIYLTTAAVAGNGFWQNTLDVDTDSILQTRGFNKHVTSLSEPARSPELGTSYLQIRGLPGQIRPRPIPANAPSLRTSTFNQKAGTRIRVADPKQHSIDSLNIPSLSRCPPPGCSKSKNGIPPPPTPPVAVPKTKPLSQASISVKGPARISASTFTSEEDFKKLKGYEQLHWIPQGVPRTLDKEHHFGTTAAGFTCDTWPCNGRKTKEALKAKVQGSTVYTTVMAPKGGRGHIVFNNSGKTEVVDVPGGETVERLRTSTGGPIKAVAKVSRGGQVRVVGTNEEDSGEEYKAANGKH